MLLKQYGQNAKSTVPIVKPQNDEDMGEHDRDDDDDDDADVDPADGDRMKQAQSLFRTDASTGRFVSQAKKTKGPFCTKCHRHPGPEFFADVCVW